jgi:hypothetical protein
MQEFHIEGSDQPTITYREAFPISPDQTKADNQDIHQGNTRKSSGTTRVMDGCSIVSSAASNHQA